MEIRYFIYSYTYNNGYGFVFMDDSYIGPTFPNRDDLKERIKDKSKGDFIIINIKELNEKDFNDYYNNNKEFEKWVEQFKKK